MAHRVERIVGTRLDAPAVDALEQPAEPGHRLRRFLDRDGAPAQDCWTRARPTASVAAGAGAPTRSAGSATIARSPARRSADWDSPVRFASAASAARSPTGTRTFTITFAMPHSVTHASSAPEPNRATSEALAPPIRAAPCGE